MAATAGSSDSFNRIRRGSHQGPSSSFRSILRTSLQGAQQTSVSPFCGPPFRGDERAKRVRGECEPASPVREDRRHRGSAQRSCIVTCEMIFVSHRPTRQTHPQCQGEQEGRHTRSCSPVGKSACSSAWRPIPTRRPHRSVHRRLLMQASSVGRRGRWWQPS